MKPTFHTLEIHDVRKETKNTVSIAFEVPKTLEEDYQFVPGQYLTLKTGIKGEEVRRSYSISSALSENELRVAVKQVENGQFSTFANHNLSAGDQLEVMTPQGGFTISPHPSNANNYIFYAAGSGITPVLSMVRSILEQESDSRVFLYYGNKSTAETIFKSELDDLASAHSNFELTYFLSREDSGDSITNGRIDETKCGHFYDKELSELKIAGIYTCGPESMIGCVRDFYIGKGLLHKVHFELFSTPDTIETVSSESVDQDTSVDSKVTIIIDDEEYNFELNTEGKDVLSAAQDADADVPFSCKGGVCCTCRAKVLEGKVRMTLNFALEEDEVEEGFILTCQSHPLTKRLVISYDEY